MPWGMRALPFVQAEIALLRRTCSVPLNLCGVWNTFGAQRREVGMSMQDTLDASMADRPMSEKEIEAFDRDAALADPDQISPELFPCLWNLSARHLYQRVLRPDVPESPEFVTLRFPRAERVEFSLAVARWNMLWESAQFRRRFFDEDELPTPMARIADRGDVNVVFVPRTEKRFHEYAPLYHLLNEAQLRRHGLPALRRGQWPFVMEYGNVERFLPDDLESRLQKAWASAVWRHLLPGSAMSGFTGNDPIRMLAHNLDFWIPAVTGVVQEILSSNPVVDDTVGEAPVPLIDGGFLDGAVGVSPRVGSDVWRGEQEAAEAVAATVERADGSGRLRAIMDAVRSHRVEDDFSDRWTFEREDFERRLHRKRSKVQVRFVELTDTIPVQGPETEIVDRLVFSDFLALLDERDRQVVVLLRSGFTKLTEIADVLGYRNHSPISKRLNRVRAQAERFFDQR